MPFNEKSLAGQKTKDLRPELALITKKELSDEAEKIL